MAKITKYPNKFLRTLTKFSVTRNRKMAVILVLTVVTLSGVIIIGSNSYDGTSKKSKAATVIVNIKDFGAVGNGVVNDRDAINRAITSLSSQPDTQLYFPTGTYKVEFDATHTSNTFNGKVNIKGDGIDNSVIDVYPKTMPKDFEMRFLSTQDPSSSISFDGLSVLGPTILDPVLLDTSPPASFISALLINVNSSTKSYITLNNTKVIGFREGIFASNGNGVTTVTNSVMKTISMAISVFTSPEYYDKHVIVDNSTLSGGMSPEQNTAGRCMAHTMYIHPHVALKVTNSHFVKDHNCYYYIQHYGTSVAGLTPKYEIIQNNTFDGPNAGILTAGSKDGGLTSEISGNTFNESGVVLRNNARITSNTFNNTGIRNYATYSQHDATIEVANNTFNLTTGTGVDSPADGWKINVHDNIFNLNGGMAMYFHGSNASYTSYGKFSNNIVTGTSASNYAVGYGTQNYPTSFEVNGNVFKGKFGVAPINIGNYYHSPIILKDNDLEFANLHFNISNAAETQDGLISGSGNFFRSSGGFTSGDVWVPNYSNLHLRNTVDPQTRIAQASVIVGMGHNSVHINGNSQITRIDLDSSTKPKQKFFNGTYLVLIPDDTWSLGSAGNIRPLKTSARTIGQPTYLVYDAIAAVWNETLTPPPSPTASPTPTPAPTLKPGDVNGDGLINITDLSIIASNFGKTGMTRSQGDLNGDGSVAITDLSILSTNWGK